MYCSCSFCEQHGTSCKVSSYLHGSPRLDGSGHGRCWRISKGFLLFHSFLRTINFLAPYLLMRYNLQCYYYWYSSCHCSRNGIFYPFTQIQILREASTTFEKQLPVPEYPQSMKIIEEEDEKLIDIQSHLFTSSSV